MFNYMKVKGEVERDVKALDLAQLTIYQPGLIESRRNDFRLSEKIASFIPFIDKITAANLGEAILLHTFNICTNCEAPRGDNNILVLDNSHMRNTLPALRKLYPAAPNL